MEKGNTGFIEIVTLGSNSHLLGVRKQKRLGLSEFRSLERYVTEK